MSQVTTQPKQLQYLNDYQIVEISGEDSLKLLQGQLTCDLQKVTDTQAQLGGYCTIKGRLSAIFYAMKYDKGYWLLMPKSVSAHFVETLSKYAVFFQTRIQIKPDCTLVTESSNTNDLINQSTASELADNPYKTEKVDSNHYQLVIQGANSSIALNIFVGDHCETAAKTWITTNTSSPQNETQQSHLFNLAQVAFKIPMVFGASIDQFLPHNIGLPEAKGVDFEKGCYIGQEIVARMHYRGKLKTHAYIARLPSELLDNHLAKGQLSALSAIYDEANKKVGELISSGFIDRHHYLLISLSDTALEKPLYITDKKLPLKLL